MFQECLLFLEGLQDNSELETGNSFVVSRKPERTESSVFSAATNRLKSDSSAHVWQAVEEREAVPKQAMAHG